MSDRQLDEALLKLRHRLEAEHPGEILDFYESPIREGWKSEKVEPEETPVMAPSETTAVKINSLLKAFEDGAMESLLSLNEGMVHRLATSLLSKIF